MGAFALLNGVNNEMLRFPMWLVVVFVYGSALPGSFGMNMTKEDGGYLFCANGMKIEHAKICNGNDDCEDGFMSDECLCENRLQTPSICGRFNLLLTLFPGYPMKPERGESMRQIIDCIMDDHLVECNRPGSIHCADKIHCIRPDAFCDGTSCCPDRSDERAIGFGLKCSPTSNARKCVVPDAYTDDHLALCGMTARNCFERNQNGSVTGEIGHNCFQCLNKEHVILTDQVCDGVLDCSDFSDECLCENSDTPEICFLMYDPAANSNETCDTLSEQRDVSCGKGLCISRSVVCDGVVDCPNGVDERYCQKRYVNERDTSMFASMRCVRTTDDRTAVLEVDALMCDGNIECDRMEDECSNECSIGGKLPPFCVPELECLLGSLVCNGVWNSDTELSCGKQRVGAEELNCPGRFYCDSDGRISIEISQVCDLVVDCDDGSDESRERQCDDGRYYCKTDGVAPFLPAERVRNNFTFVPEEKTLDGHYDCDDGSDECSIERSGVVTTSSRTEMICNKYLRYILWVNAALAFTGNACVILYTLYRLWTGGEDMATVSKCNHMLVLNLSLADFLMGIYLVVLVIQSVQFSGNYCPEDRVWRMSHACSVLGAMSLISSEMSVIVMAIMAVFRLATVYNPLKVLESGFAEKCIKLSVALAWAVSILIALVPLLESVQLYFITDAWVKSPIFRHDMVSLERILNVTKRAMTYSSRGYGGNLTELPLEIEVTRDIEDVVVGLVPHTKIHGWFGMYGQNSVCLSRLLVNTSVSAWEYSTALICINFVTFCFMAVVYIGLVKTYNANDASLKGEKNGPSCKSPLQSKVTRLLVTDFLCWIPLCTIAFVYLTGVPIDRLVYGISGIVLLPINSALNPILYSSQWDTLYGYLKKKLCWRCMPQEDAFSSIGSSRSGFRSRTIHSTIPAQSVRDPQRIKSLTHTDSRKTASKAYAVKV